MSERIPTYHEDLFAVEALQDPFPHYRAIRDLGSAVWIEDMGVYALGRFEDVQAALRAPDILMSGQGVGFNEIFNAPPPEPPAFQSDGERHRRLRNVIIKQLTPAALKQHRSMLKTLISAQIGSLIDQPEFDGVASISQHLPLQAVTKLVGLPEEGSRNMLEWAAAGFNAGGPLRTEAERDGFIADVEKFQDARDYFQKIDPKDLADGSWTAYLFKSVGNGKLTFGEARAAMSAYVIPSLDTTIFAMTNLLYNLGVNDEQWQMVKRDKTLIPSAVLESVRHSAVVRWFSRVARTEYHDGSVRIPAGSRIMLMYGSANRDERHYPDPDSFDVRRNPTDQLGWGTGPHLCVGLNLARMEMEVMLESLVEKVERIEIGGSTLSANRGLYGFSSLGVRLYGK